MTKILFPINRMDAAWLIQLWKESILCGKGSIDQQPIAIKRWEKFHKHMEVKFENDPVFDCEETELLDIEREVLCRGHLQKNLKWFLEKDFSKANYHYYRLDVLNFQRVFSPEQMTAWQPIQLMAIEYKK